MPMCIGTQCYRNKKTVCKNKPEMSLCCVKTEGIFTRWVALLQDAVPRGAVDDSVNYTGRYLRKTYAYLMGASEEVERMALLIHLYF